MRVLGTGQHQHVGRHDGVAQARHGRQAVGVEVRIEQRQVTESRVDADIEWRWCKPGDGAQQGGIEGGGAQAAGDGEDGNGRLHLACIAHPVLKRKASRMALSMLQQPTMGCYAWLVLLRS